MFKLGKKNKALQNDTKLYAPVTGQLIALENVSDPVFAQKIMGDGYAIEPSDSKIVSPVAGEVTVMQHHAIGFKRADGLEVLLHLGIDTVSLNGAPFKINVSVGEIVEAGESLGQADWEQVEAAGLDKTTMVIITNTADKLSDLSLKTADVPVTAGDVVGEATSK
ncbi:MAG: PTS glucose transporter subunit IIA [Streptococcaceae bacterium]|nr:PTS glucose transporter subunit IIA [Streptococcaceae bacterium]